MAIMISGADDQQSPFFFCLAGQTFEKKKKSKQREKIDHNYRKLFIFLFLEKATG